MWMYRYEQSATKKPNPSSERGLKPCYVMTSAQVRSQDGRLGRKAAAPTIVYLGYMF